MMTGMKASTCTQVHRYRYMPHTVCESRGPIYLCMLHVQCSSQIRSRQCHRSQHELTAVECKHACKRRSGATDRLHASQVGISHRGQGAVDGRLRVCVCVPYLKLIWNDRYHYREHHRRRTATPRFRDYMLSLKSSCARRSTTYADREHIYATIYMYIKHRRAHRQRNK